MRGSLSGTLATMGPGVPYAIGAKFAHPDRPAIALVGDGAMQMNGMMEMVTAAKYYREWSDPRLIVAVLNNGDLNQVTWEMRAMSGAPQFEESQHIPDLPYADIARSFGLDGSGSRNPSTSSPPGIRLSPRTGPSSSTSAPTLPSRRSRRTPSWTRSRPQPQRSSRVTATAAPW